MKNITRRATFAGAGVVVSAATGLLPARGVTAELKQVRAGETAPIAIFWPGMIAEKNGFAHVVMGLSGGIDSALVAVIAVDTLGPERVSVVVMPSPYSSQETQQDARDLLQRRQLRENDDSDHCGDRRQQRDHQRVCRAGQPRERELVCHVRDYGG